MPASTDALELLCGVADKVLALGRGDEAEKLLGTALGNMLKQLQSVSVVRCDEAAWRFLGLSLAGWNVPLSLGLAVLAACGFRSLWRPVGPK